MGRFEFWGPELWPRAFEPISSCHEVKSLATSNYVSISLLIKVHIGFESMQLLDAESSNDLASDIEASHALPTNETSKILEPLLCLLAACRGLQSDPAFEAVNVPDDKFIAYTGEAGVRIFNKKSRFNRIMAIMGRLSDK